VARDGADVDDAGAGIFLHQGQDGAGDAEEAKDIALEHSFPIFVAAFGNGVEAVGAAGVVDQDVNLVCFRADKFGEGFDAGSGGDIKGMDEGGSGAGFAGGGGDFFEAVEAAGAEEEFGAVGGEGEGGGGAKAAGGAGDEDPFIGKHRSHEE